jgi:hypothetical protein
MDKKVTIAIVAIVAVFAVIVCASVLMQESPKYDPKDVDLSNLANADLKPCLEVYGNVNEDLVIDNEDVKALEAALKDGTASKLKYADANFDGKVDSNDVEYIKKIMNASFDNPVEIKHIQRYSDGDYYVDESKGRSTTIPVKAIATTASANMLTLYKHLGICDEIKAVAWYSKVDQTLLSEYQKFFVDSKFDIEGSPIYRVGGSAGYFSEEMLTKHIVNDGITTLITADNASSYLCGPSKSYPYGITEDRAYELGLDVIRIAPAATEFDNFLSDLALIALVTGKDLSTVKELQSWISSTISEINDKLTSKVGKGYVAQKSVAVSSSNSYVKSSDGTVETSNYISSFISDYTKVALGAGGKWVMQDYPWKEGSSSSSKYTDLGKWLDPYNIETIIAIKTASGFSYYDKEATLESKVPWSCMMAFSDSEAFYNNSVYVLSGDLPVVLRIVYAATILYPDLFSDSWAEKKHISYAEEFLGMDSSTIKNGKFYVTMEDMGLKN